MKNLIFHPQAKLELENAIGYYEKQKIGLGLDLLSDIEQILTKKIKINPDMGKSYFIKGLRCCVIRRFPYIIFYTELQDIIWIVAIAHSKCKPNYWQKRIAP